MNSVCISSSQRLKCQRFTFSGCKDIGIIKLEFEANYQFIIPNFLKELRLCHSLKQSNRLHGLKYLNRLSSTIGGNREMDQLCTRHNNENEKRNFLTCFPRLNKKV